MEPRGMIVLELDDYVADLLDQDLKLAGTISADLIRAELAKIRAQEPEPYEPTDADAPTT